MEKVYYGLIPPNKEKQIHTSSKCTTRSEELKWPLRFLRLAAHISEWSKDPSTKAGAVIVDNKRRIVSVGYNGFPRGVEDLPSRLQNREIKYKMIVHAEANALLTASQSVESCGLYCTHLPCASCAGMIIQRGIIAVYVPKDMDIGLANRWREDWVITRRIFEEANVGLWQI